MPLINKITLYFKIGPVQKQEEHLHVLYSHVLARAIERVARELDWQRTREGSWLTS